MSKRPSSWQLRKRLIFLDPLDKTVEVGIDTYSINNILGIPKGLNMKYCCCCEYQWQSFGVPWFLFIFFSCTLIELTAGHYASVLSHLAGAVPSRGEHDVSSLTPFNSLVMEPDISAITCFQNDSQLRDTTHQSCCHFRHNCSFLLIGRSYISAIRQVGIVRDSSHDITWLLW